MIGLVCTLAKTLKPYNEMFAFLFINIFWALLIATKIFFFVNKLSWFLDGKESLSTKKI